MMVDVAFRINLADESQFIPMKWKGDKVDKRAEMCFTGVVRFGCGRTPLRKREASTLKPEH
jgi:hypothetical protein